MVLVTMSLRFSVIVYCAQLLEIHNIIAVQDEFGNNVSKSGVSGCSQILVEWLENDTVTGRLENIGLKLGWLVPLERSICDVALSSFLISVIAEKLYTENVILMRETPVYVKQGTLYRVARKNRMITSLRKLLGRRLLIDGERNKTVAIPFLLRSYEAVECLQFLEKPSQQPSTWFKNKSSYAIAQKENWVHLVLLDFLFGIQRREREYCFRLGDFQRPIFIVPLRKTGIFGCSDILIDILGENFFSSSKIFLLLFKSVSQYVKRDCSEVMSEINNRSSNLASMIDVDQETTVIEILKRNFAVLAHLIDSSKTLETNSKEQFA
ncbi:hypothetical protein Gasu2_04940 [Galdieria sulphuraria]|nr:hypothetical protein Gasu2_04940 [Galdieria sulphuraria]